MQNPGNRFDRFWHRLRFASERWPDYLTHRVELWVLALLFRPFFRYCVPALQDAPVLVCTMGKVGSVSVEVSLRRNGWKFTFGCHRISKPSRPYPYFDARTRRRQYAQRMLTRFQFPWLLRRPHVRVISTVREPVGRIISLYLYAYSWLFNEPIAEASMETLLERFPKVFDQEFEHPLIPGEFLSTEIQGVLGIDVFSYPFDPEKGWTRIRKGHVSLLISKAELPDERKTTALTEWLQSPISLARFNSATDHAYGSHYAEFKRRVRIPYRFAAKIYQSRFMHHFYSAEERAAFWRRWEPQLDDSLPLPAWVEDSLEKHHPPQHEPSAPKTTKN